MDEGRRHKQAIVPSPKKGAIKAQKRAAPEDSGASNDDGPMRRRRRESSPDQSVTVTKDGLKHMKRAVQRLARETQELMVLLEKFEERLAESETNLQV